MERSCGFCENRRMESDGFNKKAESCQCHEENVGVMHCLNMNDDGRYETTCIIT